MSSWNTQSSVVCPQSLEQEILASPDSAAPPSAEIHPALSPSAGHGCAAIRGFPNATPRERQRGLPPVPPQCLILPCGPDGATGPDARGHCPSITDNGRVWGHMGEGAHDTRKARGRGLSGAHTSRAFGVGSTHCSGVTSQCLALTPEGLHYPCPHPHGISQVVLLAAPVVALFL